MLIETHLSPTTSETTTTAPSILRALDVAPWEHPIEADPLLRELSALISRHVVLPKHGPETLALWTLHTYAFHLRNVSTYIGLESPEKRCGKTTLLGILSHLVNRPVVAANISSSAFFRVIEELRPTLLIDEADTFLQANEELRGILNSGYTRQTAYVVRVRTAAPSDEPGPSSRLAAFSSWCPKIMAAIGHLPETLADRCIVLPMHRKTSAEPCERFTPSNTNDLRRKCARFVLDHAAAIAAAHPDIPAGLHDRAADIWEPLFVLADLAGQEWARLAREAAVDFSAQASSFNPISALLIDICTHFAITQCDRTFTRDLVDHLNRQADRPWAEATGGRNINGYWLAHQLRPYGIRPHALWIGDHIGKGYAQEDFLSVFRRYVGKAEIDDLKVMRNPPSTEPAAPTS